MKVTSCLCSALGSTVLLACLASEAHGQFSLTGTTPNPYEEKFDSYGSGTPPEGWSATGGTFRGTSVGTGTNLSGGFYAFGTAGDFSFGVLRSNTASSLVLEVGFVNNTGNAITELSVSWNYEQWRYMNTSGLDLSGTGALSTVAAVGGYDFTGAASGTAGAATPVTFTLTGLSIPVGETFGFRWNLVDASGSDNGIGIDDFKMTYVFTPTGGGGGGDNYFWVGSDSTLGGNGTWDALTSSTWSASDTTVTPTTWDSSKTATFGGTAPTSNVTVNGAVNVGAGMSFTADGYTLTGGTINLTGATPADNSIAVSAGTATINSPLNGTAGMTKNGTAKLVLGGNNAGLSGGVVLAAGTLAITSANALGTNTLTLNGGTFTSADATALTINNDVIIGGAVGLGEGGTGNLTFAGSTDLNGGTRVLTVGSGVTVDFSGAVANGGITKAGEGVLKFSADAVTLTTVGINAGQAVVEDGTVLTLTGAPVAAAGGEFLVEGTLHYKGTTGWAALVGTVRIADGGTYIHNTTAGISTGLNANFINEEGSTFIYRDSNTPSVSNRVYSNLAFETEKVEGWSAPAVSGGGAWNVNGDLTIGSGVTVNFATGAALTLNFAGNVDVLGKFGGATGANSFEIAAGKSLDVSTGGEVSFVSGKFLTVKGEAIVDGKVLGTAATVVEGTLGGSGIVNDVSVIGGGTVAPGDGGVGTLTTGKLTLESGAAISLELDFANGSASSILGDKISANGDVSLNGATLQLAVLNPGSFTGLVSFTLIDNLSSTPITGTFAGLAEGAQFNFAGYTATITYQGGTGNDVQITVPEPGAGLFVLAGLVGAFGWRRRRA